MKPLLLCIPLFLLIAGLLSLPPLAPPAMPRDRDALYQSSFRPGEKARVALEAYARRPKGRVFAASEDGAYGAIAAMSNTPWHMRQAMMTALATCQQAAAAPCRILDIDGQPYDAAYARFRAASHDAKRKLSVPPLAVYHFEGMDWGEAPATELLSFSHVPTPMRIEGVVTITTPELVRRLQREPQLTLIDARSWERNGIVPTLPNAALIDRAGDFSRTDDTELQARLGQVAAWLQPDKSRPIVVFSDSAGEWQSLNAALRLRKAGYTHLLWYRGGVDAWRVAGLPLVAAVPYASLDRPGYSD